MVRLRELAVFVVLVALGGSALAQVPPVPDWSLSQNAPEPFCNLEGAGGTAIQFGVAEHARVTLDVWDASMASVVRVLLDGVLAPGSHMVAWDGHDSLGVPVPDGTYPYRMTATDDGGTEVLFQDTKVAHMSCATSAVGETWTVIKAVYR